MIGEQSWKQMQGEEDKKDKGVVYAIFTVLGIVTLLCLLSGGCVDVIVKTQEGRSRAAEAERLTDEQRGFKEFFARHGSPASEDMAKAVTATKRPELRPILAAVAIAETGADPTVRNGGYKGRHHGAFQVNPAYHGPVSDSPVEQVLQAEQILSDLLEASNARGSHRRLKTALVRYNGGSSVAGRTVAGRYADRVMKLARSIK